MRACAHSRTHAFYIQRSSMHSIAFLSQKGGSGKTTLAVHIAVAAGSNKERVILIDTDPQGSASIWSDARSAVEPSVIKATAAGTRSLMEEAQTHGSTLAVIDTAPHTISGIDIIAAAVDY